MRVRVFAAVVALAGAFLAGGCGRSGVGGDAGIVTLDLTSPGAAGHIEVTVGDALVPGVCPGDGCSVTFAAGTRVTLVAFEQVGRFGGWTGAAGNDCGSGTTCSFRLYVDATAGVRWVADVDVTVDAGTAGGGRVVSTPVGIDCPGTCAAPFDFGSTVSLAAETDGGFLTAWSGDCAGDTTPCVLIADGARTTAARFDLFRAAVFGSGGMEYAEAVTPDPLDPAGFFATGSFDGPTLTLSSTITLTRTGQRNGFVARFDAGDRATWGAPLDGAGDIRPHAIAAFYGELEPGDEEDTLAVYVGGALVGEEDFDADGTNDDPTGSVNGFTLKFEDLEPVPGERVFAGNDNDGRSLVNALAVSPSGLVSTGVMSKRVDFAGLDRDNGSRDEHQAFVLLQELESGSGSDVALIGRNGNSHTEGAALALHPATGDPIVVGFHDDQIDIAPCNGVLTTNPGNDYDALLFRLQEDDYTVCPDISGMDAGGDERWTAVTTGTADHIAMTGFARTNGPGVIVRAFDMATGLETWRIDLPADVAPGHFAIAHDPSRQEYVVAGSFEGTISVGAQDFDSSGGRDILVLRLDRANGAVRLARALGGAGDDVVGGDETPGGAPADENDGYAGNAIAVLSSGHAVIAGWTTSTEISGVAIKNGGGPDPFVMRVGPGPAPQQP